jgi:DNA polymerase elongation subunit (family B)
MVSTKQRPDISEGKRKVLRKQGVTKRRRLFFDVETSYCIGKFWRPGYKVHISAENIIKQAGIICICYKWEEEREVYALSWDKKQNDKKQLQKFIEIANQASELVGHNGDKFDLPWIRTRCLYHDIEAFPHYSTLDTLKISRSKFRFPDNKLNTIASYLGIGQKLKTESGLWDKVILDKNEKALGYMIEYCKRDVVLLEKVYNRLKTSVEPKFHYGVLFGSDRAACPECGSDDLVKVNSRTTASGLKKIQMKCNTCGRYHSKTDK